MGPPSHARSRCGRRLTPDAYNEGAFLVLQGQATGIGGTSWSAPVWAGICALINEARHAAGLTSLPFLNPLIYPLLGTACFRDVTSSSNGKFSAGPGYDRVTGLGVPNVKRLIASLTQAPEKAVVARTRAKKPVAATG